MKKTIIACATAAIATLGLYAATDEIMVIKLTDGTKVEYNVKDVEMVNFDVRVTEDAFTVTPPAGDAATYTTIPTMLRVPAASGSGDATLFGFGTVEATAAEDLTAGEYGVYISVSASKIYAGDIDLATEKDSYTVKLVKYTEGGAEYILDEVTEGTLSTKLNSKNRKVTMTLDAVMKDGTAVTAKYEGVPTDVESIEAMVPGIQYGNEFYYYDYNGTETKANVVSAVKATSISRGVRKITFEVDKYIGSNGTEMALGVPDDFLGKSGTYDLATESTWSYEFGAISLYGSYAGFNQANNGTLTIEKKDDTNYLIHLELKNAYLSWGQVTDRKERVILHYEGPIE